jgi:hypothetical protein
MFLAAANSGLLRRSGSFSQISLLGTPFSSQSSNPPNPSVSEGDFLLRFVARTTDATAITVPSGWTTIDSDSDTSGYGVLVYQFAGSGGSSVAGNFTNGQVTVTYALRGVNASDPISDFAFGYVSASGGPVPFGALTLDSANDWVIAFARTAVDISASDSPPAGLTSRVSGSHRIAADSNGPFGSTSYAGSSEVLSGHGISVTYTVGIKSV